MYDLLKGMTVVEGAAFVAAPSCGLYLSQMGADVIRFDSIGGGPDYRRWPVNQDGASLYWEGLNKGKRSIAIDLAGKEGRELAQRLATGAAGPQGGLFVTNFPSEGFLSYETLKKLRDDLICIRVLGWADGSQAMDYTVNAALGLPLMTGPVEDPRPVNHVLPAWDLLTGAYCAFAVVSALLARSQGRGGCEIRVPLGDVGAATLANLGFTAETLVSGAARPRMGNDLFGAFGRDFVTADGKRLMLLAITPRQWRQLIEALGIVEAVAQVESQLGLSFAASEGVRFEHRAALYPHFERALASMSYAELAPKLDGAGVTWGPYQTVAEAHEDTRLFKGNPMFQDVRHPSGVPYPTPGAMGSVLGQAREDVRPAPRLGEHTDEVLAQVLGMSSGEIGKLHDRGVVAGPT